MRLTSKGQITIPIELRERFGLAAGTEVEFVADGDELRLRKTADQTRGDRAAAALLRHQRRGGMSTAEVMALTRGER